MNFQAIQKFMDQLTAWKIPGNAISIWHDGQEVFLGQSGYADLDTKEPMTPDKLLYIYSCSKVATVTAALQLYEKGCFNLDDPVYSFLPEYKELYVKTEGGKIERAKNTMTIRHLFTMTSGFSYNISDDVYRKTREESNGQLRTRTFIKHLASETLSHEPGVRWTYGMSHDILGAVIEVISGKRLSKYMQENIFEPLDINDICFVGKENKERMAQQYQLVQEQSKDIVKLQAEGTGQAPFFGEIRNVGKAFSSAFADSEYESGGAGIVTSVREYAKFCNALANTGLGHTGERILKKETIHLMRTNQLNEEQKKGFNWGHLAGYSYGLGVRTMLDVSASGFCGNVGEFGWGGAAGATVLVDLELNLSLFYAHHMLNPQEHYYQPRLRDVLYRTIEQ